MKAAVLHGPGDLRIEDIPDPQPGPGELLLRVETVGICGSDLAEFDHGPVLTPLHDRHPITGHLGPIVLGHEFSGVVELSRSDQFASGDLVACAAAVSCGVCRSCVSGRMGACRSYWAVGLHRDGGMAEYCIVPASTCVRADGLTADAAALAQPMAIASHAVRRSRLTPDETALVIGVGGIGTFIAHLVATTGATLIASDLDRGRLEVARRLGVEHTIEAGPEVDLAAELVERGTVPDVVFEVTGTSAGLAAAQAALAPGTRMVAVGIQRQQTELDLRHLTLSEHEIIGTNALDIATDLPPAVKALRDGAALWADLAPIVEPIETLVSSGLHGTGSPPPIKTLTSPQIERTRRSMMM